MLCVVFLYCYCVKLKLYFHLSFPTQKQKFKFTFLSYIPHVWTKTNMRSLLFERNSSAQLLSCCDKLTNSCRLPHFGYPAFLHVAVDLFSTFPKPRSPRGNISAWRQTTHFTQRTDRCLWTASFHNCGYRIGDIKDVVVNGGNFWMFKFPKVDIPSQPKVFQT